MDILPLVYGRLRAKLFMNRFTGSPLNQINQLLAEIWEVWNGGESPRNPNAAKPPEAIIKLVVLT